MTIDNHTLSVAQLPETATVSSTNWAEIALAELQRGPFQKRVRPWMIECFGPTIPFDKVERNHRFLEEAIELVQAGGCTASEAHQLVDYVFGRPVGELRQEVGGVMVTLAALCIAHDVDMHADAETELARIWTKVPQIRAKQASKPKHSPLPEITSQPLFSTRENAARWLWWKPWIERRVGDLEPYEAQRRVAQTVPEDESVCARCGGIVSDPLITQQAPSEHEQLVAERDDLAERLERLCKFTRNGTFSSINLDERRLLLDQQWQMGQLLHTLNMRIAAHAQGAEA